MRNFRVMAVAVTVAVVFVLAGFVGLGHAQEAAKDDAAKAPSYVGVNICKMCHSTAAKGEIYEKWAASLHSKAFANLPAESKKDAKCLACHVTGAGKPGGYDAAAKNAASLEGVICEGCHGPASEYKAVHMKDKAKALTLGLVMPTEVNCKVCHAGTVPEGHKALPKFDFATFWKKIEHKLPPKPAK